MLFSGTGAKFELPELEGQQHTVAPFSRATFTFDFDALGTVHTDRQTDKRLAKNTSLTEIYDLMSRLLVSISSGP